MSNLTIDGAGHLYYEEDATETAEDTFAASIDDGVVDHDAGGQNHEAEE